MVSVIFSFYVHITKCDVQHIKVNHWSKAQFIFWPLLMYKVPISCSDKYHESLDKES